MQTITVSVDVDAPPDAVYGFFEGLDDARYRRLHEDHRSFEWETGTGLEEGSVARLVEELHGMRHEERVHFARIDPGVEIEMEPADPMLRMVYPRCTYSFEPSNGGTTFTATHEFRIGPVSSHWKAVEDEFVALKTHYATEADNLKRIVESEHESGSS